MKTRLLTILLLLTLAGYALGQMVMGNGHVRRATASAAAIDPALRIWYEFAANNATNVIDSTTNHFDAYASDAVTTWWTNTSSGSWYFTGPNGANTLNSLRVSDAQIGTFISNTIVFWHYELTIVGNAHRLWVQKGTTYPAVEYEFYAGNAGCFELNYYDGSFHALDSTVALVYDRWEMIAASASPQSVDFYSQGTNIFHSAGITISDSSDPCYLGCIGRATSYDVKGWMGEFRKYDRVLTASEILVLFNATKAAYGY